MNLSGELLAKVEAMGRETARTRLPTPSSGPTPDTPPPAHEVAAAGTPGRRKGKSTAGPTEVRKYRNKKFTADGIAWDSRKEFRRWGVLVALANVGAIHGLRRQVRYDLVVNGIMVCAYVADFVYTLDGRTIVEDVKSSVTRKIPVYRLKKKLMRACHGIEIAEV